MEARRDELENFKTAIDLRVYAASCGYELDQKASGPNSPLMVDGAGDKVVIGKGRDGHWTYFSCADTSDNGSIIDFVQKRGGGSLGEVRKLLRPWIGAASPPPPSRSRATSFPELQPIERDIVAVRAHYEAMHLLGPKGHPYLTGERGIPARLLGDPRFAGRVRIDERGNAVFPHFNIASGGVCGFELKNAGFTGFAKGGAKGLWASSIRALDHKLVITESAVDALSYAVLHGHGHARFVSLAGQISPEQLELVVAAAEKLPSGDVVLALDNDEAGIALGSKLREALSATSKSVLDHRPSIAGHDWNDMLRERGSSPPPPELGRG